MILYRTRERLALEHEGRFYPVPENSLDALLLVDDLARHLAEVIRRGPETSSVDPSVALPPIGSQEVWAAGVTYLRSRAARMAESQVAGGGDFYDRVYSADRPELFFKCMPHKVVGPGGPVGLRSDAHWSVPEPELVLVINPRKQIIGYTIGNDMSSRDIEGQNPLYLPQAKIYDRSCAIGPGILVRNEPLSPGTKITISIERGGITAFSGETSLSQMKRRPDELVDFLYRDQTFPCGCFLFTGTGIVPPDSFSLQGGDVIRIGIEGIGFLRNPVG